VIEAKRIANVSQLLASSLSIGTSAGESYPSSFTSETGQNKDYKTFPKQQRLLDSNNCHLISLSDR
jgi:hypothetical protein